MFESFCKEKLGPLTLRLALGLVCVYHGFLKIMAEGGTAWQPGLSVGWQLGLAWAEFAAGLAVLVGFYCRWAAAIILGVTAVNIAIVQGWQVTRLPLRSLEPIVLIVLVGFAVLFLGAGELSLDKRGSKSSSGKTPSRASRAA